MTVVVTVVVTAVVTAVAAGFAAKVLRVASSVDPATLRTADQLPRPEKIPAEPGLSAFR